MKIRKERESIGINNFYIMVFNTVLFKVTKIVHYIIIRTNREVIIVAST